MVGEELVNVCMRVRGEVNDKALLHVTEVGT